MPICSMCHEDKPPEAFALRSKATGELQSHCRTCHAAYRRQHYLDNRAIYIAREIARINGYRIANRVLIVAYLATHPCVDCGESDLVVLEFDHRDPSSKRSEVSVLAAHKPWHIVLAEIEKCDVRCVNCHRRRSAREFGWRLKGLDRVARAPLAVAVARPDTASEESKTCTRCKRYQPVSEYSIKNPKTGTRRSICKTCVRAYGREHYRKNRPAYLAKATRNRRNVRELHRANVASYMVGKSCIDCGESDPAVLEFDHRDGVEKEDAVARLLARQKWAAVEAEIEKCDVRCGNCHRRRTAAQFGYYRARADRDTRLSHVDLAS